AVAEFLVEAAVLPVGDVVWQEIDVLDHERLACRRGVAGEAGVVDRDRRLGKREIRQRVVLRESEAQSRRRAPIVAALDEIERRRVARRDAARLRQDHVEEREEIALRRECDTDARELGELAMTQRALL